MSKEQPKVRELHISYSVSGTVIQTLRFNSDVDPEKILLYLNENLLSIDPVDGAYIFNEDLKIVGTCNDTERFLSYRDVKLEPGRLT